MKNSTFVQRLFKNTYISFDFKLKEHPGERKLNKY